MPKYAAWYPAGANLSSDEPIVLHDETKMPSRVLRDIQGFDAPPWRLSVTSSPQGGGYLSGVTTDPRSLVVPVWVTAGSFDEMRAIKQRLVTALDPNAGAGTLVIGTDLGLPGGEMRRIAAVYEDGLRGDGSQQDNEWWRYALSLTALDPHWYSMELVTASWAGLAGEAGFPWSFDWSFPAGGVAVEVPLDLGGDAETFPSWQIDPPFYRVRATNDRSGEWWEIRRSTDDRWTPLTLAACPATVRDADGVNRYGQLTSGSRLFGLLPGDAVSVQVDGGTTAFHLTLTTGEAWKTA